MRPELIAQGRRSGATSGARSRPPRPRLGRVILAYDRLYRLLRGLDTAASEIGSVLCMEVRRSRRRRRPPGGTRVRRGDRIGVIHLNNAHIAALHVDVVSALAVGLEFRRQLLASLHALAALAGPGGPLSDVSAFTATTIFHRGLARLGFVPERDGLVWPSLVGAYQRALLSALHPAGDLRLRRSTYPRARRLWMSRDALLARYGGHPASRGAQVNRTSWRTKQA